MKAVIGMGDMFMKSNGVKHAETIFGVLAGNMMLAFAVAAFIAPQGIIMGGATGIGLTVSRYVAADLSVIVLVINGALFLAGALVLGKKFVITTIASTFLYPLCLSVLQRVPGITGLTDNLMLATIYGGAALGIGIGLVIRVGASTGGTDVLALIINQWFHLPVAVLVYVVDFLVLGSQALFSDAEQIMYGLLALVLETVLLNKVMLLGQSQIQLFIMSDNYEEIRSRMLDELDAGVTMMHVEAGYSREDKKGVLCVIPKRKLYPAKELVQAVDEKAFFTIAQVNEVRGRGFSLEKKMYSAENDPGQPM